MSDWTIATSTPIVEHDGVHVSQCGRAKVAETPKRFWRVWLGSGTDWRPVRDAFPTRQAAMDAASALID